MDNCKPLAIVTGAGRGIGLGIAQDLAKAGYAVAVWDYDPTTAEAAAASLRDAGYDAIGLPCDVSKLEDVIDATDRSEAELGIPTLLVNNAGTRHRARLEDLSRTDWEKEVATNLTGTFQCTQTVGRRMLEAKQGAIVNISSISASIPHPLRGAYSPTKAAVVALTQLTAVEWGGRGIRCNAVSPGPVVTPAHGAIYSDSEQSEARRAFVPLGRLGEPSDIGDAVVFLASEAARFINGANLVVDGGTSQSLTSLFPTIDPEGRQLKAARDALH